MSDTSSEVKQRNAGLSIHLLTATGALTGFLALEATASGDIRRALLWLIVCQVLDGIDGPLARGMKVEVNAPQINGHVLDLVIDYVTCVVVPTMLLTKLELAPRGISTALAGAIMISSALWFARSDQETEDSWFRGFPATWNVIVPSLIILNASQLVVAVVCFFFCILQLTNIEFPHVIRARNLRRLTMTVAVAYFFCLTVLSATYPTAHTPFKPLLLIGPLYMVLVAVWRSFLPDREFLGHRVKD